MRLNCIKKGAIFMQQKMIHLSSSEAGSDNAEKGSSRQKIDELKMLVLGSMNCTFLINYFCQISSWLLD